MLSHAHDSQALYVPAAMVSLERPEQDMLHDSGLAITSVEVDLQLSTASLFKFTVSNTFDAERSEFLTAFGRPALDVLKLGTRVWIRMGYGDRTGQPLLLSGYITSVGTNFAESASPDLEVSGMDSLYRLTLGTGNLRRETTNVRNAFAEVARNNNMSLVYDGTPPEGVTLDKNMQSDLEFMRQTVAKFSVDEKWEFYSRASTGEDVLHVHPRGKGPEIATLKRGADLLSFKPEVQLGNQLNKVVVHGWNEATKEEILGEAQSGKGKDGGKTGGEVQRGFLTREVVRHLRLPVQSKQEADLRAAAELANWMSDHLKGDGETFGLPELLPDTRIKLTGLGGKFSRSFYVTKTVHRYDSAGYRTRFSVEEPDA